MSALLSGSDDEAAFQPKMPKGFVPATRDFSHSPQETRRVRCFLCHHQQVVSKAATSTQCGRCSVYLSLADHEITTTWTQGIRTRGNVKIRKAGAILGGDLVCHDLEVDGRLSAKVDCSGDVIFRNSGRVMGHVYCRNLLIEKGCEVIFPQGVKADSAEVFGTIVGDLTCSGPVKIAGHAAVEGDVLAGSVDLKPGGRLSGKMTIQPDLTISPSVQSGLADKLD